MLDRAIVRSFPLGGSVQSRRSAARCAAPRCVLGRGYAIVEKPTERPGVGRDAPVGRSRLASDRDGRAGALVETVERKG